MGTAGALEEDTWRLTDTRSGFRPSWGKAILGWSFGTYLPPSLPPSLPLSRQ
jgi:hypothetical protein